MAGTLKYRVSGYSQGLYTNTTGAAHFPRPCSICRVHCTLDGAIGHARNTCLRMVFYLAKVSFSYPDGPWCGFPFGITAACSGLSRGTGWYWSPEIEAAKRHLHADIVVHDLWIARCECDCRPYDWIRALYEERRRLGSDTRGYPLKLGLNSLYGKTAQRCGRGPYHDTVSAGLITAITRARLIEAIGQDPEAVVMHAGGRAVFSPAPWRSTSARG